ncbi:hypothetical protein B5X24_HaOG212033 [Helicoverpa armigera]|nr:hypothetical protein B5X24_HaOG212033 [Helicoverpa armigera]
MSTQHKNAPIMGILGCYATRARAHVWRRVPLLGASPSSPGGWRAPQAAHCEGTVATQHSSFTRFRKSPDTARHGPA